jgi:alanine dehydrogenase
MRVGVPTEVTNHEYRVAITPAGAITNGPVAQAHGLEHRELADVLG